MLEICPYKDVTYWFMELWNLIWPPPSIFDYLLIPFDIIIDFVRDWENLNNKIEETALSFEPHTMLWLLGAPGTNHEGTTTIMWVRFGIALGVGLIGIFIGIGLIIPGFVAWDEPEPAMFGPGFGLLAIGLLNLPNFLPPLLVYIFGYMRYVELYCREHPEGLKDGVDRYILDCREIFSEDE